MGIFPNFRGEKTTQHLKPPSRWHSKYTGFSLAKLFRGTVNFIVFFFGNFWWIFPPSTVTRNSGGKSVKLPRGCFFFPPKISPEGCRGETWGVPSMQVSRGSKTSKSSMMGSPRSRLPGKNGGDGRKSMGYSDVKTILYLWVLWMGYGWVMVPKYGWWNQKSQGQPPFGCKPKTLVNYGE